MKIHLRIQTKGQEFIVFGWKEIEGKGGWKKLSQVKCRDEMAWREDRRVENCIFEWLKKEITRLESGEIIEPWR